MPSERNDVIICGRLLGSYTDWDDIDLGVQSFADFLPADGVDLPPFDNLYVDFNKGQITGYDDGAGDLPIFRTDLINKIKDLPVVEDEQEPELALGERDVVEGEGIEIKAGRQT